MITFVPTPARAAGLSKLNDRAARSLISSPVAALMVGAGYLLFFGRGIANAIHIDGTDQVLDPVDYGTFTGVLDVVTRIAGIAGAVLIFVLVCRYLRVPRELAGIPRYPASPIPALVTLGVAFTGIVVAGVLLNVLQGPDPDPNAAGGGIVGNPWALFSLFSDVNAGVVEEIVIVAIPVLIGRRAGWHPMLIVGISMAMRWPFHIYHGFWASLPWAMLWGGAYVTAFLYLRRLAPLIVFHAMYDARIDMQSAYGDAGGNLVLLVGVGLVLGLALRITSDQRRRLNPAAGISDAAAARYVLLRGGPHNVAILIVGGAVVAAAIAVEITLAPDLITRLILGAVIVLTLGVLGKVIWSGWTAANVIVHQDIDGATTGVIRWHTTYTGDTSIDTITTGIDAIDAVGEVAALDHQDVVLARGDKARRATFAELGHYPATGWHPFRRIRIPAEAAAAFPPVDHLAPSA